MNLLLSSQTWLLLLLGALLLAAAAEDAVRLRISNLTTIGVLVGAVVAATFAGGSLSLWQNAAVLVALLAAGTVLFGMGKMGGGDVKLLAAVGAWVDLRGALGLFACIFIAGGVLALLIIGARTFGKSSRLAVMQKGSGIPYGIAIAVGTAIYITLGRSV